MDYPAFVPPFLAAGVEWVEAFTIVLAVSLTIGWVPRSARGRLVCAPWPC
jgi:hypothetical protein